MLPLANNWWMAQGGPGSSSWGLFLVGGFAGAPISKAVVFLVSSATLLPRPLPPVIQGLADFLAFPAPFSQLLFGASLLYVFRINERLLGSEKFGVFAGLSVALPYAAVGLANAVSGLAVPWPVAPFAYLGANFVSYALDIPPTSHFSVFGVNLTDKARNFQLLFYHLSVSVLASNASQVFVYAAAGQVLLASHRHSLLPAVLGAAFGLMHRYKRLGLARMRVPRFVSRLLSGTLGRLLGGTPEQRVSSPPNPSRLPRGSPAVRL